MLFVRAPPTATSALGQQRRIRIVGDKSSLPPQADKVRRSQRDGALGRVHLRDGIKRKNELTLRTVPVAICFDWAAGAKRMLGAPTTPLFSITDFISLEVNQVRAFDTSATS